MVSFVTYYLFRWLFPDESSVPSWLGWIFGVTSALGTQSSTALPVILSWICAVAFAFVTNRIVVFQSGARGFSGVIGELGRFVAARLLTLFADLLIMFLLVDLTGLSGGLYELFCKVLSNIVIIILNYVLSKLIVFRKRGENEQERIEK